MGEGHTTALFWEYDSRLGRRWNLDPKPVASMSDYACLANNPIFFIDLLGDKFDPSSEENVKKVKTAANTRMAEINSSITEVETSIQAAKGRGENTDELQAKLTELNDMKGEVNKILVDLSVMETSDQLFILRNTSSSLSKDGATGGTYYSKDENAVVMLFGGDGRINNAIHELRHGYQFLQGKLSFGTKGSITIGGRKYQGMTWDKSSLYDATDEVEAYRLEYSMNPERGKEFLRVINIKEINVEKLMELKLGYRIPIIPKKLTESNKGNTESKNQIIVSDENQVK